MNYSLLTTVQKFDAIARLARATSQFCKPVELATSADANTVTLEWVAKHAGVVGVDMATGEAIDIKDFTSYVKVKVSLATLAIEYVHASDTEGIVQQAIAKRYLQGIRNVLDAVDLSPLTRTRKASNNEDVQ